MRWRTGRLRHRRRRRGDPRAGRGLRCGYLCGAGVAGEGDRSGRHPIGGDSVGWYPGQGTRARAEREHDPAAGPSEQPVGSDPVRGRGSRSADSPEVMTTWSMTAPTTATCWPRGIVVQRGAVRFRCRSGPQGGGVDFAGALPVRGSIRSWIGLRASIHSFAVIGLAAYRAASSSRCARSSATSGDLGGLWRCSDSGQGSGKFGVSRRCRTDCAIWSSSGWATTVNRRTPVVRSD